MGRSTTNGGCNGKIMGTWREKVGKYGTRTYTMEVSRWAKLNGKLSGLPEHGMMWVSRKKWFAIFVEAFLKPQAWV
jgi:hypothetical protein